MHTTAPTDRTYDPNNLSAMSYSNGFTLWHYKAEGVTSDDIEFPGFFNGSSLRSGDVIFVNRFHRSGDHLASAQFSCVSIGEWGIGKPGVVTVCRTCPWIMSPGRKTVAA